MAKFGSVEWQEDKNKEIFRKLSKKIPLTDEERTYIFCQTEHNRK